MAVPNRYEFTEFPRPTTVVTVKIEDTAKGARLEVKIEHGFTNATEQETADHLDYIQSLAQGVYARLEPVRASRPLV